MSIKLYNGFCIKQPVAKSLEFLKDCVKQMEPMVVKQLSDAACHYAVKLYLSRAVYGLSVEEASDAIAPKALSESSRSGLRSTAAKSPLFWAWSLVELSAETSEKTKVRTEVDDNCHVELTVSLFPVGDMTLGLAYGSDRLIQAFLKLPGVEDFSYWNNVDMPKNVAPCEWELRKQFWGYALPSGIPARDGFSYSLFLSDLVLFEGVSSAYMDAYLQEHREDIIADMAFDEMKKVITRERYADRDTMALRDYIAVTEQARKEQVAQTDRYRSIVQDMAAKLPETWAVMNDFIKAE